MRIATLDSIHIPGASQPCLYLDDTPGLSYNDADDSFELLYTSKHDAIYSYRAVGASLSWSGHGDVWNSTNSFILTAVVGKRTFWKGNYLNAFFIKYH